jgi:hypothetical protein
MLSPKASTSRRSDATTGSSTSSPQAARDASGEVPRLPGRGRGANVRARGRATGSPAESASCRRRISLLERRIPGNGAISKGAPACVRWCGLIVGEVQMISGRRFALVCLSLAGLFVASSPSRAEVLGTCSCKTDTCRGRWELRAANLKALRTQCRAKTDDHGLLSRVHRPKR